MTIGSVLQRQENGTDGLASAYQQTQVTGNGSATVEDTGGMLFVPIRTFVWKLLPRATATPKPASQSDVPALARDMAEDSDFRKLAEQGLADLAEGRHSKLADVKRRVGDL